MSPELIAPQRFGFEKSRPTKSSDCYALGMVIYETVSGKLPFHRDTDYIVSLKVVGGERPPRGRSTKFAGDLWESLEMCWAPRPGDRPSIESVRQRLQKVSNLSVSHSPGGDSKMEEEGDSDSASGYSAIDYPTGGTIDERSTFDFSVANHTVRRLPSIEATGEVDADCMGGEEIVPAPGYNFVSLTSSDSALLNVLGGPQISPPATETRRNVDVRLRNSNRQAFGMLASHPTYTPPVEPLPPDRTPVSQTITTRPSESSLLDQWPRPWSDSGDNTRWLDELFGGGRNIAQASGYSEMCMATADSCNYYNSFNDGSPLQNSSSYDYSNLGASPRIPDLLKCGIHEPGQVRQEKDGV